jgi:hypothetical protein
MQNVSFTDKWTPTFPLNMKRSATHEAGAKISPQSAVTYGPGVIAAKLNNAAYAQGKIVATGTDPVGI